ncbi:MAG TPA: group I intron-associated PD-(D/E)XK endonuclease [Puia sp.]|nr:group I intron-associated PD-(D/E)XK endonuclease [Puia sp.]
MDSVQKGRLAEARVTVDLLNQGAEVFIPAFGNAKCDLVAVYQDQAMKIEVKHASRYRYGSYEVSLRQIRPNRSKMITKLFNAGNSDILAVYIGPLDRVVFLLSSGFHGRTSVNLNSRLLDSLTFTEVIRAHAAGAALCPENKDGLIPGGSAPLRSAA